MSTRRKFRCGFTLIELLVVIAIIALLMSILVPALRRARVHVRKVVCSSNLRQWGVAYNAYAADNEGFFPYNSRRVPGIVEIAGAHLAWCSSTMSEFWRSYLVKLDKNFSDSKRGGSNILSCPTEKWHHAYHDVGNTAEIIAAGLAGYNILRHRNPSSMDYEVDNAHGTSNPGWASAEKFGIWPKAPIMFDIMQRTSADPPLDWYSDSSFGSVPYSCHITKTGRPEGGNFLFEDGRVEWHPFGEIEVGGTQGGLVVLLRSPRYRIKTGSVVLT